MIPSTLLSLLFLLQADATKPKPVVLKAARLFDGKSDAVIRDGVLIVEGRTIKAVGAGVTVPEGLGDGHRPRRRHALPGVHRRPTPT